ncbi:hypothetical protein RhiirB3_451769 [Rhizophagus irregularis]|nr:hypothetical protein RhiirB3_451769 [Rhizophagus irregularis]
MAQDQKNQWKEDLWEVAATKLMIMERQLGILKDLKRKKKRVDDGWRRQKDRKSWGSKVISNLVNT